MGNFSRSNPGSGNFTVPDYVDRVWVSCVGGGANGSIGNNGPGGGGGGWGSGDASVGGTTINFTVGGRQTSSSCLGIVGGGASGRNGGGFSGSLGGNGDDGNSGDTGSNGLRGGAAGGVNGGGNLVSARVVLSGPATGIQLFYFAGGGGNGNDGFGGNAGGGQNGSVTGKQNDGDTEFGLNGGDGGSYGGGGGAVTAQGGVFDITGGPGSGATGFVYVSWITVNVSKTTLRSNEPINVSWNSPVTSGSQNVSWSNTGTTNITRNFAINDSRGARSTITFTILPAVRINSFTANPNPQTSGLDGVPNYNTSLTWSTTGATSASINRGIGTVAVNGSTTDTDLPQSVAGVTSPATRTYTLTASDGFNTDTATLTVEVFNDNTPNNYTIPNRTNLEPNTSYVTNMGAINGIDMVTNVIGGPGVTVTKNNLQNYVSSINIVNGDSVQLRFFSDPFNTDPTGQPTAPKTLSITIGTVTRTFTISTRAPDVNETFNLPDENNRVPFPDIDTISEPSLPFISSDTLSIDDIELQNPNGVEIKTSNGNTQIRIRRQGASTFSGWTDTRSI